MAITAIDRALPIWFTKLSTHQTVLPRFQRFQVWTHDKITELFNTILRDLPIGAALVLEIGNEEPFISRPLEGAPQTGERVTEHLLDGQQRMTALWRGFHNNYAERTYFLCLLKDEETGMPYYVDSVSRWKKQGEDERRPLWANTRSGPWERNFIPLEFCGPTVEAQQHFRAWAREVIPDADKREEVSDVVANVRQKFSAFNLPFLSLPVATKKEVALDVFIKMNKTAVPLSIYDIIVAQVEAAVGSSLHDLVANAKADCPAITAYYPVEDLVLYAGALLQDRAPTNATYFMKDFGPRLVSNWNQFLTGMKRAIAFLEQERIFDDDRLPTDVVVPVLTALWSLVPDGLDAEGRARTWLSKYLWRASFSTR